jgi:hypothetical protein
MPHIIRDAEFKTSAGQALWPGTWVHPWGWGRKNLKPTPLDDCYLWRVEQHDGVMLLAGQGVDLLVPLTPELADECILLENQACELLATCPQEWAALRKLGWGVYLHYYTNHANLYDRLSLYCQRGTVSRRFLLAEDQQYQLEKHPAILSAFLATCWWRLKHPRYASALASQHPREFWDWPNVPDVKQLHVLGQAAFRTQEGSITISPNGKLTATGRKAWDFPGAEGQESDE